MTVAVLWRLEILIGIHIGPIIALILVLCPMVQYIFIASSLSSIWTERDRTRFKLSYTSIASLRTEIANWWVFVRKILDSCWSLVISDLRDSIRGRSNSIRYSTSEARKTARKLFFLNPQNVTIPDVVVLIRRLNSQLSKLCYPEYRRTWLIILRGSSTRWQICDTASSIHFHQALSRLSDSYFSDVTRTWEA